MRRCVTPPRVRWARGRPWSVTTRCCGRPASSPRPMRRSARRGSAASRQRSRSLAGARRHVIRTICGALRVDGRSPGRGAARDRGVRRRPRWRAPCSPASARCRPSTRTGRSAWPRTRWEPRPPDPWWTTRQTRRSSCSTRRCSAPSPLTRNARAMRSRPRSRGPCSRSRRARVSEAFLTDGGGNPVGAGAAHCADDGRRSILPSDRRRRRCAASVRRLRAPGPAWTRSTRPYAARALAARGLRGARSSPSTP